MKKLFILLLPFLLFAACQSNSEKVIEEVVEIEQEVKTVKQEFLEIEMENNGITLTGNNYATSYPDATIGLAGMEIGEGKGTFGFDVANYNLADQTSDDVATMCANSAKGQHIHFILNNAPYKAFYESKFESEVNEGHNVLLAFLSRSYHMSIKNGTAHLVKEFTVGDGTYEDTYDENGAHMFYSRPKGTYTGADTERLLLDFFLVNTDLSEDGYKVRATINDSEFMIEHWMPFIIEGMPMGTNTIKLELLDASNELVESPFNPVERTIELVAE